MLQSVRTGDIAYLVDHLLNRHRGLGSVSSTAYIRPGGTCLQSQHFRSGNKEIRSSRSSWIHSKLEASLGYIVYSVISPRLTGSLVNPQDELLQSVHLQRALLISLSLQRSPLLTAQLQIHFRLPLHNFPPCHWL